MTWVNADNPDPQPCGCHTASSQVDMCSRDWVYHCVRDRGEHAVNRRLSRKRGILQRSDSGYLLEVPDCSDETGRLQEAQTLFAGRCCRLNRVS